MKKEIILTILATLALIAFYHSENNQNSEFDAWKARYGVKWQPHEQVYRKIIFEKNLLEIKKHNADPSQTYTMGVNKFTIYTDEEFFQTYLMTTPIPEQNQITQNIEKVEKEPINELMGDIDWTTEGKVSPVRDQGQCSAGYAFATTGTVQSLFLFKNETTTLSAQQMVDCTVAERNLGCKGGWPSGALLYIRGVGIASEEEYPYMGKDGSCKRSGGKHRIDFVTASFQCKEMLNDINDQPIAVTVDATKWKSYEGGIFNTCSTTLNHAVLLVGVIQGNWKVRNSWGTDWGENGFMRLAPGNTCGICVKAGYYAE